jgi:hypothetical protein
VLIKISALFTGTDRQVYGEMRVSSMRRNAFFAAAGGKSCAFCESQGDMTRFL